MVVKVEMPKSLTVKLLLSANEKEAVRQIDAEWGKLDALRKMTLKRARTLGCLLDQAKRRWGQHGKWEAWLAKHFPHRSYDSANRYRNIHKNWKLVKDCSGIRKAGDLIEEHRAKRKGEQHAADAAPGAVAHDGSVAAQLYGLLHLAAPGLASKEKIEQSTSFVFQHGHIYNFNDELSVRVPCPAGLSLTGAVPGKQLLRVLEVMQQDSPSFTCTDKELVIRGTNREAGLLLERDIVLPIHAVETPDDATWVRLPARFVEAAKLASRVKGKDESKFHLTCVHIHPDFLEASDDDQILRWSMKTGVTEPMLVRGDSIAGLPHSVSELNASPSWLHFRCPDNGLIYSVRQYIETYPDTSRHLDVSGVPLKFPPAAFFREAIDAAKKFTYTEEKPFLASLTLTPGIGITARAEGVEGWFSSHSPDLTYDGPVTTFNIGPDLLLEALRHEGIYTIGKSISNTDCLYLQIKFEDLVYVVAL